MPFVPSHDRVAENSTSNSQSVFTVTGALDVSYNAFSAFMTVGDTTIGGIVEAGVAFKSGILTYSAANEVTVTSVFESKGTFSSTGTKEVFMGQPAAHVLLGDGAQALSIAVKSQYRANLGIPGDNLIMVPSGEITQRGLGSKGDVAYDFDRWNTLVQTAAVTVSQLINVENTTPFMMRSLQAQASAQRFGRIQWNESKRCLQLRGQTVVLSGRVRMSASTTLRYAILEWTGTADSVTKDAVNDWASGTFTAGNFFLGANVTVTAAGSIALTANTLADITPLSGAISGSMNNLAVMFWTDSTQAQNVTLDIGKVKLELGAVPTQFIAPDWRGELERCKAYYWKTFPYATAPVQNVGSTADALQLDALANGIAGFLVKHPRTMFSTPVVTTFNPSAANSSVRDATNNADRSVATGSNGEGGSFLEFAAAGSPCRNFVHATFEGDL